MVTLALAKQHLEYEANDRDDLINQYIAASASWIENYTGKALTVRAVTDELEAFGGYIIPSRGPFISLTSIAYTDIADASATVTGSKVVSGRIYAPTTGWPAIAENTPVTITYQAGYATVPADLVSAQLLLIGEYFANREAGSAAPSIAAAVENLCRPYRALML